MILWHEQLWPEYDLWFPWFLIQADFSGQWHIAWKHAEFQWQLELSLSVLSKAHMPTLSQKIRIIYGSLYKNGWPRKNYVMHVLHITRIMCSMFHSDDLENLGRTQHFINRPTAQLTICWLQNIIPPSPPHTHLISLVGVITKYFAFLFWERKTTGKTTGKSLIFIKQ